MTDEDINKLASRLTKSLATKEDLEPFATKDDLKSFATKDDIKRLERRLERRIDNLDKKADSILEFADAVDETVTNHDKRLKRIESIPVIAHHIKR